MNERRCPTCNRKMGGHVEEPGPKCRAMVPPGTYKTEWTRCAKPATGKDGLCGTHRAAAKARAARAVREAGK